MRWGGGKHSGGWARLQREPFWGPRSLGLARHGYEAPYHLERTGVPLEQRHEPYVELVLEDRRCRILSLFALNESGGGEAVDWVRADERWSWSAGSSTCEVTCSADAMTVRDRAKGKALEVRL